MVAKNIDPELGGNGPLYNVAIDFIHNLFVNTILYDIGTNKCAMCSIEDFNTSMITYDLIKSACPKNVNFHNVSTKIKGQYIRKYLKSVGKKPIDPRNPTEPLNANINTLCQLAGLDECSRKVFIFLMVMSDIYGLRELVNGFGYVRLPTVIKIIASAVNLTESAVQDAVSVEGRLHTCGLIDFNDGTDYLYGKIWLATEVKDVLSVPNLTPQKLLSRYLTKLGDTNLTWSDFAHIVSSISYVREILRKAIGQNQKGVNILFHGTTGTGKTELAKLLARELGVNAFIAKSDSSGGEAGEYGSNPDAGSRINSLQAGQWLLKGGASLLLFDEMEDLFRWGGDIFGGGGKAESKISKQGLNRLLENNNLPTIWTTNNIGGVDQAFIRRFTYAVEFKPLETKHRARIIRRYLNEGDLTDTEVDKLAEKFAVSPAQISNAISTARLTSTDGKPKANDIEAVLSSIEISIEKTGQQGKKADEKIVFDSSNYSLEALNTNENLIEVANKICEWKQDDVNLGLSMLLYGPSGVGKSEFVKYLANRMGKEVLIKGGSSILSMWVGGNEANIRNAFMEAREKKAILLFDEVDNFLQDRATRGQHSWEITTVNEFLQQLEAFKGFVCCTTNLMENIIDKAAVRRFLFKVAFKYPTNEQCVGLFKTMFKSVYNNDSFSDEDTAQIKESLSGIYGIAPGDMAVLVRKEKALGRKNSIESLVSMLKEEVAAKNILQTKTIGFGK